MDIQYYGANCIVITGKGVRVVIDDNLAELGQKPVAKSGDILLYTGQHADPSVEAKLLVDHAGEYEAADVSIYGIPARAHMDEEKQYNATMYRVMVGDLTVFIPGHIYPELSDDDLEDIGLIDVMLVPVGGNGYTLDPIGALKVIKKIEPKLVIPTHYADKALKYPVPQQSLEDALQGLAMEPRETTAKLRVKPGEFTDVTQLVVLERS
jgi:L-ascorbate metabolism protein UlaG (beta-lactamase superfamily)